MPPSAEESDHSPPIQPNMLFDLPSAKVASPPPVPDDMPHDWKDWTPALPDDWTPADSDHLYEPTMIDVKSLRQAEREGWKKGKVIKVNRGKIYQGVGQGWVHGFIEDVHEYNNVTVVFLHSDGKTQLRVRLKRTDKRLRCCYEYDEYE